MTLNLTTATGVLLSVLLIAVNGYAVSTATPQPLEKNSATPVELGAEVNNLVFTGTVKKIPDGTALVTATTTYLLTGGNFDAIVGKEVNIIGKVIKEGSIELDAVVQLPDTDLSTINEALEINEGKLKATFDDLGGAYDYNILKCVQASLAIA